MNRDGAKYCKTCSAPLTSATPPSPPTALRRLPPADPAGSAAPLAPPGQQGRGVLVGPVAGQNAPRRLPPGAPVEFPRVWKNPQPNVEGRILAIDAPVQERAPIWAKAALAGALALIVTPVLAFLPFVGGNTITVRYARVEDAASGAQRSVKIIGDPQGSVSVGDWVAIWGREDAGNIYLATAYNYTTQSMVKPKRR